MIRTDSQKITGIAIFFQNTSFTRRSLGKSAELYKLVTWMQVIRK